MGTLLDPPTKPATEKDIRRNARTDKSTKDMLDLAKHISQKAADIRAGAVEDHYE